MSKRPDVAVSKYRAQTDEINLAGTANPLLPSLTAQFQTYNRGVGGSGPRSQWRRTQSHVRGRLWHCFSAGSAEQLSATIEEIAFSIPFGNRVAQADYGVEQLQYRQSQVSSQRDTNTIVVDVSARMTALRQAHARYNTARDTRALQEQLLEADRQRFTSGAKTTTFETLMADQRALVTAQISEVTALAAYANARTSLDHTLGETLEKNNITLEEGLNGHVERQSQIPDVVDTPKK